MKDLHYLPDGRIKIGDHFIIDEVAIRTIHDLHNELEQTQSLLYIYVRFDENFPYTSIEVIKSILKIGAVKHKPGRWKEMSVEHHATKAMGHLKDFIYGVTTNPHNEDTLAHALTRLAMAVSVREAK
jgi:hypothetical protein